MTQLGAKQRSPSSADASTARPWASCTRCAHAAGRQNALRCRSVLYHCRSFNTADVGHRRGVWHDRADGPFCASTIPVSPVWHEGALMVANSTASNRAEKAVMEALMAASWIQNDPVFAQTTPFAFKASWTYLHSCAFDVDSSSSGSGVVGIASSRFMLMKITSYWLLFVSASLAKNSSPSCSTICNRESCHTLDGTMSDRCFLLTSMSVGSASTIVILSTWLCRHTSRTMVPSPPPNTSTLRGRLCEYIVMCTIISLETRSSFSVS
mmetsp:Transcript_22912/g.63872  ORF Transcript_22912/g.63872 Transcript_22912/m.63872 type:complete len:267 (-) Transcript_22912:398-1198(-)